MLKPNNRITPVSSSFTQSIALNITFFLEFRFYDARLKVRYIIVSLTSPRAGEALESP